MGVLAQCAVAFLNGFKFRVFIAQVCEGPDVCEVSDTLRKYGKYFCSNSQRTPLCEEPDMCGAV